MPMYHTISQTGGDLYVCHYLLITILITLQTPVPSGLLRGGHERIPAHVPSAPEGVRSGVPEEGKV